MSDTVDPSTLDDDSLFFGYIAGVPEFTHEFLRRLDAKVTKSVDPLIDWVFKFNENHDESGRFASSDGGSATLNTVADKINEKTTALTNDGATFDSIKTFDQQQNDYNQLLELGQQVAEGVDPEGGMTPEDGIQFEAGYSMTEAALTYTIPGNLASDQGAVVSLHDSAGQLAGAVAYTVTEEDNPADRSVELHYLGTTGIVDGAGSALFGKAVGFAASKDMGMKLTWLDTEAKAFWEKMGFAEKTDGSGNPRELYLSATDASKIAGKING